MSRHPEDISSSVGAVVQQTPSPSATLHIKQALNQLLQALKSPNTPEQRNQVLQILKSNPPLMSAFIKCRQQQLINRTPGAAGDLPKPSQLREQLSCLQRLMAQLQVVNNNSNNGNNEE